MYRIRFHGRGGQGMKTASRILGTAFFLEGYEVQDAPIYGAERRGAPIFAYVRASKQGTILERGVIQQPDLVIVADDTLVSIPAAGVLSGLDSHTIFLIDTREPVEVWKDRLHLDCEIITLPATEIEEQTELRFIGAACAGAAARLTGVIRRESFAEAIRRELGNLPAIDVDTNLEKALAAYDAMAAHEGKVTEGRAIPAKQYRMPDWIDLPFEEADLSAPVIFAGATSVQVRTGLWRTLRPVIDYDKCNRCWWVCSTFCPDSAINVKDGRPEIDYDHCKGCMICVAQCPPHAISAIPEQDAQKREAVKT